MVDLLLIILIHHLIIQEQIGELMLVCGQEEPLHKNEYLYSLNEDTKRLELSHIEEPRLNRYSFVWLGDASEWVSKLSELLRAILVAANIDLNWFLVWDYNVDKDFGGVKSKWLVKKRQREGWHVHIDQNLAIASKVVKPSEVSSFMPPDCDWQDGALLMFLGSAPSSNVLLTSPLLASIKWFSFEGHLAPSKEFLSWLAENNSTIIYQQRSDVGHVGLIVVSVQKIEVEDLQKRNIIQHIKVGNAAGDVWKIINSYA